MPCACCRTSGSASARPYGIVEITPEREYMLVTEFSRRRRRNRRGPTSTTTVIDQGLLLIRMLWDAGIAHRDIKPGNLMVRSGELLLIDVAFVQVRPSPWRQAVDLGNMMLVLAVRTDPERVYRRALAYFTEAELAEAFAATRGVASPTQLRAFMKRDPRDLLGEFRALAPHVAADRAAALEHPAGRHWRPRLLAVTAAAVVNVGVHAFFPAAENRGVSAPACGTGHSMILSAQAVPSGGHAALHRRAPVGLEYWRRGHRQREGQPLAGLRSRRIGSRHRNPDGGLRHLGRPARSRPTSPACGGSSIR